ncbi:uncharacterized protein LOC125127446 [Phacochoerus africanus]|uniref:uncharacterized protein LOC125127446 n=1 Tax=Phacochoerus africanus TaxID=41426 RepID=UPI001FD92B27|nr:uncharacterized protein LOC125127446 [Phacochoerus africanus]
MENQSLKPQYKKRTEKQSKQAKTITTGRVPGGAAAATALLAGTKAADPSEGGRCGAVWRASGRGGPSLLHDAPPRPPVAPPRPRPRLPLQRAGRGRQGRSASGAARPSPSASRSSKGLPAPRRNPPGDVAEWGRAENSPGKTRSPGRVSENARYSVDVIVPCGPLPELT